MNYKMTLERFEHELLKIKSQVGPEHVGVNGWYSDGKGGRCIMGQVMFNCGVPEAMLVGVDRIPEVNTNGISSIFYGYDRDTYQRYDEKLASAVITAVTMNNQGATWHSIVDLLVPLTEEVEVAGEAGSGAEDHAVAPAGLGDGGVPARRDGPHGHAQGRVEGEDLGYRGWQPAVVHRDRSVPV